MEKTLLFNHLQLVSECPHNINSRSHVFFYSRMKLETYLLVLCQVETIQSTQIHVSTATLEIRLRSVRVKGAIILNYFNTRLEFITYSIMHYTCLLKQFILHNDINI